MSGHKTNSSMIYQVEDKKFKFSYDCGNSFEHFKIEQYDGVKLNVIAILTDLNEKRDSLAYHHTDIEARQRVSVLNDKARKYVENLLKF